VVVVAVLDAGEAGVAGAVAAAEVGLVAEVDPVSRRSLVQLPAANSRCTSSA
jgi:hypothetical protein